MLLRQFGPLRAVNGVLNELCLNDVIWSADEFLLLDAFVDALEEFGVEVLAVVDAAEIVGEVVQGHLAILSVVGGETNLVTQYSLKITGFIFFHALSSLIGGKYILDIQN